MQSMVDLFESKIELSALFTDSTAVDSTNSADVSTDRDQLKSLFDCDLSGIETKVFAEIREDLSCENKCECT